MPTHAFASPGPSWAALKGGSSSSSGGSGSEDSDDKYMTVSLLPKRKAVASPVRKKPRKFPRLGETAARDANGKASNEDLTFVNKQRITKPSGSASNILPSSAPRPSTAQPNHFPKASQRLSLTQPQSSASTRIKRVDKGKARATSSGSSSSDLPADILDGIPAAVFAKARTPLSRNKATVWGSPDNAKASGSATQSQRSVFKGSMRVSKSQPNISAQRRPSNASRRSLAAPSKSVIEISDDELPSNVLSQTARKSRPLSAARRKSSAATLESLEVIVISDDEDRIAPAISPIATLSQQTMSMTLSKEHRNTNFTLSNGYRERDDGVISLGSDDDEMMPTPPGNTETQVPSKRGAYATNQESRASPSNKESYCGNGFDSFNHDIHGLTSSADPLSDDLPPFLDRPESKKRDVDASMFSDTDDLFQDSTNEPSAFYSDMQPFKIPIEPDGGQLPSSEAPAEALPNVDTEEVDMDIADPTSSECNTANRPESSSKDTFLSGATPRARPVPIVVDGPFTYTDHLWDFAYRRVRRHTVEGPTARSDSIPAIPATATIGSSSTELDMPNSQSAHIKNLPSDTVEPFPSADSASRHESKPPVRQLALEDLHITDAGSGNRSVERHPTQPTEGLPMTPSHGRSSQPAGQSLTDVFNRTREEYVFKEKARLSPAITTPSNNRSSTPIWDREDSLSELGPTRTSPKSLFSQSQQMPSDRLSVPRSDSTDFAPLTADRSNSADSSTGTRPSSQMPRPTLDQIRSIRKRFAQPTAQLSSSLPSSSLPPSVESASFALETSSPVCQPASYPANSPDPSQDMEISDTPTPLPSAPMPPPELEITSPAADARMTILETSDDDGKYGDHSRRLPERDLNSGVVPEGPDSVIIPDNGSPSQEFPQANQILHPLSGLPAALTQDNAHFDEQHGHDHQDSRATSSCFDTIPVDNDCQQELPEVIDQDARWASELANAEEEDEVRLELAHRITSERCTPLGNDDNHLQARADQNPPIVPESSELPGNNDVDLVNTSEPAELINGTVSEPLSSGTTGSVLVQEFTSPHSLANSLPSKADETTEESPMVAEAAIQANPPVSEPAGASLPQPDRSLTSLEVGQDDQGPVGECSTVDPAHALRASSRVSVIQSARSGSRSSWSSSVDLLGYKTHRSDTGGSDGALAGAVKPDIFSFITWQDIRAKKRKSQPKYRLAKNLPHALQDHMNAMSCYWRTMPMSRTIFEANIMENTMDDEPGAPPIRIVNDIDDEPNPPWEFHYSNYMWHGEGVPAPDLLNLMSCDCEGPCDPKSTTCACLKQQRSFTEEYTADFAYNNKGLLDTYDIPIFECNELCGCGKECRNRVVQHGRKCMVNIGKTKRKGWGVFAGSKKIPTGAFIGVYAGELLTDEVSEMRGLTYNKSGRTYLLDIDFYHLKLGAEQDWDTKYCVDAYHAGNFTRFLNHSCSPNCTINACYINEANIDKPLLAVFTQCDIEPGEELCFSYTGPQDESAPKDRPPRSRSDDKSKHAVYVDCRCGAKNCTGRMFN